jgi:hypothetical protein
VGPSNIIGNKKKRKMISDSEQVVKNSQSSEMNDSEQHPKQTENKKSRRNKYKHLSLAYKNEKEAQLSTSDRSDEQVTMIRDRMTPVISHISSSNQSNGSSVQNENVKMKVRKPNKRNKYKHLIKSPISTQDTDDDTVSTEKTVKLSHPTKQSEQCLEVDLEVDMRRSKAKLLSHHPRKHNEDAECTSKLDMEEAVQSAEPFNKKCKKSKQNPKIPLKVHDHDGNAHKESSLKQHVAGKKTVPFEVNKLKDIFKDEELTSNKEDTSDRRQAKKLGLKEKMEDQLKAARFRYLNEQLYTSTGSEAYNLFQEDESAFNVYHEGFQKQVHKWPENPLDRMVQFIKSK